jgi:hypothetical protein
MLTAARFLALALFGIGCSQAGGGETPAPGTASPSDVARTASNDAPSSARGVLIGKVVTHDTKVSIVGGGPDLRVVVRKMDGTMVADGLTLSELRARDAELYQVVTSSRASADGQQGYVDATLDLGHPN